jgi:hypothetical protein
MVKLRSLILYGSEDGDEEVSVASGGNSDDAYRRLVHLDFREWGILEGSNANVGAVSLLEKLVRKTPELHSIRFADSFINGNSLVRVMERAMQRNGGGLLKSLKEVTLSRVSGIMREQCDGLVDLLPKMNIYV